MSRARLERFLFEASMGLHDQAQVDLGKLGELTFLKGYMRPGAERLAPEELGRCIDDGLVESIWFALWRLESAATSTEEFESTMDTIEEGIKTHRALKAFGTSLWRKKDSPPLPSATYLDLARRHVRHGAKRPSVDEGSQIARVLLAPSMNEALWETDWDREKLAQAHAVGWLRRRDPDELWYYILASERSVVAWDSLKVIRQRLVESGEEDIPGELLTWYFWAGHGARQRPKEDPAPPHRVRKLGYILRDNEFRHIVDRLVQVGMPKTDACRAVGQGIHRGPRTILKICQKPYTTFAELQEEAMRRMEPSYYAFLYGPDPDSDSDLARGLGAFLESRP